MPSVEVQCTGSTPVVVPLPTPTGRLTFTITHGTSEVYITLDGSFPKDPTNDQTNVNTQQIIPGVLGAQTVMMPRLFGDHAEAPTVRLASLGTPNVLIEW